MSKKINGIQVLIASKRNYILAVIVLTMLVFGGYKVNMFFNNRPRDIQLTLIESKVIDTDKLCQAYLREDSKDWTWWACIGSQYVADWVKDDYGVIVPNIDFSEDKLFVILGRQIISAKSVETGNPDVGRLPCFIVSKVYEDKTMFVYSYQGDAFGPYNELFVEDENGIRTLNDYLRSINTSDGLTNGGAT